MRPDAQEVLEARARELAAKPVPLGETGLSMSSYVFFEASGDLYAIDTSWVMAVADRPELTALPWAPGYFHGLAFLRGNIVPVFSAGSLRGETSPAPASWKQLLVLGSGVFELALLVERVTHVSAVPRETLGLPPPSVGDSLKEFLAFVLPEGPRLVLEGKKLFQSPRFLIEVSL